MAMIKGSHCRLWCCGSLTTVHRRDEWEHEQRAPEHRGDVTFASAASGEWFPQLEVFCNVTFAKTTAEKTH